MSKKITVLGTNVLKIQTGNALSNRNEYICANSQITTGKQNAPSDLEECYERYPELKEIAMALGVGTTYSLPASFGLSGSTSGVIPCGISGASGFGVAGATSGGFTLIFNDPDRECTKIAQLLGTAWMGCYWPDPLANFSCNCPLYGDMYENYLKYRLSSATFWATPLETPVLRQQFVESVRDLVEITVTGDFSQRPGDIVYLKADNLTGLVTETDLLPIENIKSGYYYILRTKNVIKNDGTHTTIISLSKFLASRFYPAYKSSPPFETIP
jgi:hypothetical protein